ncbi:MAG: AAA family ATPase [Bacteroidota bacterium]
MKTITILRGLPASGKSTYAKELVKANPGMYKRINRDDMREMLDGYHFSKSNEKFVKRLRDWLIVEALRDGKHVIVDDTNLSQKNINRINDLANGFRKQTGEQVKVEVKEFTIDLQTAIERDAKRKRPVGRRTIEKLHRQFYAPDDKKGRGPYYADQDKTLPKAIICDIDGTLAIIEGRSPFDATLCEQDALNEPIANIVKAEFAKGTQVFLFTGRMDSCKTQTLNWLQKMDIPYHQLVMRKMDDVRKDAIVKKEFFEMYVKDQYFVKYVLDDRNQVVDMWRLELGLPCLQVNYGDF